MTDILTTDYENDHIARYLAYRVSNYIQDIDTGLPYEIAITSGKTTKDAIDFWLTRILDESYTRKKEGSEA